MTLRNANKRSKRRKQRESRPVGIVNYRARHGKRYGVSLLRGLMPTISIYNDILKLYNLPPSRISDYSHAKYNQAHPQTKGL